MTVAITVSAMFQPGSICRVLGIMSLKPAMSTAAQYTPAPRFLGPMCDRCWMERMGVVPELSAGCPHGGAS